MTDEQKGDAIYKINAGINELYQSISQLKHELDLTTKRAIDWEQMHLDQIEINNGLNKQNNDLRKELDEARGLVSEARNLIRKLVQESAKEPAEIISKKMESLAHIDMDRRAEIEKAHAERVTKHNEKIELEVHLQTQLMASNHELTKMANNNHLVGLELSRRLVQTAERQTECFEQIMHALNEMVAQRRQ